MPDLIILKLIPTSPTQASTFTQALEGLTITVYDLSVQDSLVGVNIGTAHGVPTPLEPLEIISLPDHIPKLEKSIIQDFELSELGELILKSVATAVIVVDPPVRHLEYRTSNSYDLRLELNRAGLVILDSTIEYNINVQSVDALSPIQLDYLAMGTSAYVPIPAPHLGLDPTKVAFVPLNQNGQPPDFTKLVKAINIVLALDHPTTYTGSTNLEARQYPLTPAQSSQVAAEIVWNRMLYPAPLPSWPLDMMYTIPPGSTAIPDDVDQARKLFEGQLLGYHATHDAEAARLAGYVFSASAAIFSERLSLAATGAGLTFPIDKDTMTPSTTSVKDTSVMLTGIPDVTNARLAPLNPPFVVPAAYFYILAASFPVQISYEQRYAAALMTPENQLLISFQSAIDTGYLATLEPPMTIPGPPINLNQAARRIQSLGSTGLSLPKVVLAPPISVLVDNSAGPGTGWLNYSGPTSSIDGNFWNGLGGVIAQQPFAYVNLLLQAITEGDLDLVNNIINLMGVRNVYALVQITDATWTSFFNNHPEMLPRFTQPGNSTQRTTSWIQRVNKFFQVPVHLKIGVSPGSSVVTPTVPTSDALQLFIAEYNQLNPAGFDFSGPLDATAVEVALHVVFPQDNKARTWLKRALETIGELYQMTSIGQGDLQFSLMEALYARGFISASIVNNLAIDQFQSALVGSIAYIHAAAIYAQAVSIGPVPTTYGAEPVLGFVPVNPDGSLTDCIPPPNLSPFGFVQYLHEMLEVSMGGMTLGDYIAKRRGPLGDLQASMANLETPLPLVDLVNESLEALGGAPSSGCGAVNDTNSHHLAGFRLGSGGHDPATLFAAIPEHSSPATPVKRPAVYDTLEKCFTAPNLPYSQSLDVCRSYLTHIGTSRFDTMRHFREDITEFAIDAYREPSDFQSHLWRYPVRFEIALEYLHISTEEYAALYSVNAPPAFTLELYGFPGVAEGWRQTLLGVPEFLKRTGLSYCEFLELWRCEYVPFERDNADDKSFPACEPCCLESLRISFGTRQDVSDLFRKLAIFIRLWRRLRDCRGLRITFIQLADICNVLSLFVIDGINPDFIRQLAALFMLRDFFGIPLSQNRRSHEIVNLDREKRTQFLALWVPNAAPQDRTWAIDVLLHHVEDYARARYGCPFREDSFKKDFADHLPQLSLLAGFTEVDPWNAKPTSTIRFAEVLAKIYASKFTVGEIIFLFTPHRHLDGDDPFPLPDIAESTVEPLHLPDDSKHGLWALRDKLLNVQIDAEELETWTWHRIETAFHEIGYHSSSKPNSLTFLGQHFFPSILKNHGHRVRREDQQFRVDLPSDLTTPMLWHAPHLGPFHYDVHHEPEQLWIELPLLDDAVLHKLQDIRQLNETEQAAVRTLYFAPRAALVPFAAMFSNFNHAVEKLVHEPLEENRFSFFAREFALFYRRCEVIALHLAEHVADVTDRENKEGHAVAWEVLRHLLADENSPKLSAPWEDDSGKPPREYTWEPHLSGGAFAGLVGLTGTGLLGELSSNVRTIWREVSGDLTVFGEYRNKFNAPVPTILPSLALDLTLAQKQFVGSRNGFAMRKNGHHLHGAQPFSFCWIGALLIEKEGDYNFYVGAPTPGNEEPDFELAKHNHWLITLRRGQKFWTVLNRRWHADRAPEAVSDSLFLRRGAYHIEIHFEQKEPTFKEEACIRELQTGFQVKYNGPDTDCTVVEIPIKQLFRECKDATLGQGLEFNSTPSDFLNNHYSSSFRDIRRTYQRAFKGVLFAHRFRLSAKQFHCDHSSELSFLLNHQANFLGSSYYRISEPPSFQTHHAYFNLNFLPVTDPYHKPDVMNDSRVQPSTKRQSSLFDWWERIFDYCDLRQGVSKVRKDPVWFMFHDALIQQPASPTELVRYLDVDMNLAPLVLIYFEETISSLDTIDFGDERWATRVWNSGRWIRSVQTKFHTRKLQEALPYLWASDDPSIVIGPSSGNKNLTHFVADTCLSNKLEPRSYKEVKLINDDLRKRAKTALITYLCNMNRVPLRPFGPNLFAKSAHDLTDLLLQDVEVGFCERATRIEDAMTVVHNFVQRAQLGLELDFVPSQEFVDLWESRFASFQIWEARRRRELYSENWIQWDEIHDARKSEAFRNLESELRRTILTVPEPGGSVWWSKRPSSTPRSSLEPVQNREFASLHLSSQPSALQGLNLIGTPENDARLSWLAPLPVAGGSTGNSPKIVKLNAVISPTIQNAPAPDPLPLWVKAAVKLGIRFVRVSAATLPASIISDLQIPRYKLLQQHLMIGLVAHVALSAGKCMHQIWTNFISGLRIVVALIPETQSKMQISGLSPLIQHLIGIVPRNCRQCYSGILKG
jgi:hypothetical protein